MRLDDFILEIEEQRLPYFRKQLAELESGVHLLKSRTGIKDSYVDETPEWILEIKQTISSYEKIVAHYRNED